MAKIFLQIQLEQGLFHRRPLHAKTRRLICSEAEVSFIKIPGFPQATGSVIITYW